jgi:tetratricopeptide (TPR) repeat protein
MPRPRSPISPETARAEEDFLIVMNSRIENAAGVLVPPFLCLLLLVVGCGDPKGGRSGRFALTDQQKQQERDLVKRLALDPKDAKARLALADLYYNAEFFVRAIPHYVDFLKQNPDDARARTDLGTCYYRLRVYDKGKREFEQVLQKAPTKLEAIFNLALLSMETADYDRSIRLFERVAMLAPDTEEAKKAKHLVGECRKLRAKQAPPPKKPEKKIIGPVVPKKH